MKYFKKLAFPQNINITNRIKDLKKFRQEAQDLSKQIGILSSADKVKTKKIQNLAKRIEIPINKQMEILHGLQQKQIPKKQYASIFKKAEIELQDDWQYFKYLLRHKYNIIDPMRQLGLSRIQALKHDLSKFTPREWGPYSKFGFGKGSKDPKIRKEFREAVETSHYLKNPHHYRQMKTTADDLFKYRLEEIADWYAAAKAQSKNPKTFPSFSKGYQQNRKHFITHPTKPVKRSIDSYIRIKL